MHTHTHAHAHAHTQFPTNLHEAGSAPPTKQHFTLGLKTPGILRKLGKSGKYKSATDAPPPPPPHLLQGLHHSQSGRYPGHLCLRLRLTHCECWPTGCRSYTAQCIAITFSVGFTSVQFLQSPPLS
eukprot:3726681-Amphidinium_carterae.1